MRILTLSIVCKNRHLITTFFCVLKQTPIKYIFYGWICISLCLLGFNICNCSNVSNCVCVFASPITLLCLLYSLILKIYPTLNTYFQQPYLSYQLKWTIPDAAPLPSTAMWDVEICMQHGALTHLLVGITECKYGKNICNGITLKD